MIRLVIKTDYDCWLKIAAELEHSFGKMVGVPEFESAIQSCIENHTAFCSVDNNNSITGIVAIDKATNEISWLGVKNDFRGCGYGKELLETAIENLDKRKPIIVQTFAPEVKLGIAARNLYLQFGFKDYKNAEKNPAGFETVIMKL